MASVRDQLQSVNVNEDSLAERISFYLLCSGADKTNDKYKSAFKKFQQFCADKSYQLLPADAMHVTIFMSYLLNQKHSFSVISSMFYAIKWVHNVNNYVDPTENIFIKGMLDAAKRLRSQPVKRKDVVNSEMLVLLCNQYIGSLDLVDIRDLAMILTSYTGFLRIDEISKLGCNVTFQDDHFTLNIKSGKTDKFRSGNKVSIAKDHTSACAYAMLRRYIDLASVDLSSNDFCSSQCINLKVDVILLKKKNV